MKSAKPLLLFIIGAFISIQCFSQAEVTKNEDVYNFIFNEKVKKGKDIEWITTSYSSRTTISTKGNVVKTIYFQLQDDHPLMGYNIIIGIRVRLDDGTIISDEKVEIKKSGRFKVVLHRNGAGNALPIGWQ